MTVDQAYNILHSIVEQNMASGQFKKFADLDTVRQSLSVLYNATKQHHNGKISKESSGQADQNGQAENTTQIVNT